MVFHSLLNYFRQRAFGFDVRGTYDSEETSSPIERYLLTDLGDPRANLYEAATKNLKSALTYCPP